MKPPTPGTEPDATAQVEGLLRSAAPFEAPGEPPGDLALRALSRWTARRARQRRVRVGLVAALCLGTGALAMTWQRSTSPPTQRIASTPRLLRGAGLPPGESDREHTVRGNPAGLSHPRSVLPGGNTAQGGHTENALTPGPSPKDWERGALGTEHARLPNPVRDQAPRSQSLGEGLGVRAHSSRTGKSAQHASGLRFSHPDPRVLRLKRARSHTPPPRRPQPPKAHWDEQVVQRNVEGMLTPVWLVQADDEHGGVFVTPALLQIQSQPKVSGVTPVSSSDEQPILQPINQEIP